MTEVETQVVETQEVLDSIVDIEEDLPKVTETPPMNGERRKFAVVYFVRYIDERPLEEDIASFFSGFGEVSHIKLTKTPNLAFVYMKTLTTSQNKDRARSVMQEIQKAGKGLFTVDVARSPRRFPQKRFPPRNFMPELDKVHYQGYPRRQVQPVTLVELPTSVPPIQYNRVGEVIHRGGQPYRQNTKRFRPQGGVNPSRQNARNIYYSQVEESNNRPPKRNPF